MSELDIVKKALGCIAGNGNYPDDCPCCFRTAHEADCERNIAKFAMELLESQEQTIKNLLSQIDELGKHNESEWVKMHGMMIPELHGYHECKLCGYHEDYHNRETLYPYCPCCGATMKNGVKRNA